MLGPQTVKITYLNGTQFIVGTTANNIPKIVQTDYATHMRFVLHYRGPLRSNGAPTHKHQLREEFHRQLKTLWRQPPLNEFTDFLKPKRTDGDYSLLRTLDQFVFVPLIAAEMNVVAEISVVLLRPESPGHLITQGGDIDNRLKTLFDALTMPRHLNALPTGAVPIAEQTPYFYCLLEDDNLVTSIDVKTEQLLEPVQDAATVDLVIAVTTRVTRLTMGNGNFA